MGKKLTRARSRPSRMCRVHKSRNQPEGGRDFWEHISTQPLAHTIFHYEVWNKQKIPSLWRLFHMQLFLKKMNGNSWQLAYEKKNPWIVIHFIIHYTIRFFSDIERPVLNKSWDQLWEKYGINSVRSNLLVTAINCHLFNHKILSRFPLSGIFLKFLVPPTAHLRYWYLPCTDWFPLVQCKITQQCQHMWPEQ
jgi:hypothetical protein